MRLWIFFCCSVMSVKQNTFSLFNISPYIVAIDLSSNLHGLIIMFCFSCTNGVLPRYKFTFAVILTSVNRPSFRRLQQSNVAFNDESF